MTYKTTRQIIRAGGDLAAGETLPDDFPSAELETLRALGAVDLVADPEPALDVAEPVAAASRRKRGADA